MFNGICFDSGTDTKFVPLGGPSFHGNFPKQGSGFHGLSQDKGFALNKGRYLDEEYIFLQIMSSHL